MSCLTCGRDVPFAITHEPSGVGVCFACRAASAAVRGGADYQTPHTHEELMRVTDLIMQSYLGEHGFDYGAARFAIDHVFELEDALQRLADPMFQREVNALIGRLRRPDPNCAHDWTAGTCRKCHGYHDCEHFVDDLCVTCGNMA